MSQQQSGIGAAGANLQPGIGAQSGMLGAAGSNVQPLESQVLRLKSCFAAPPGEALAIINATIAPNCVIEGLSPNGELLTGPNDFMRFYSALKSAWPEFRYDNVTCAYNAPARCVIAMSTAVPGRWVAPFCGVAPPGAAAGGLPPPQQQQQQQSVGSAYVFDAEGRVTRLIATFDHLAFARSLGVQAAPAFMPLPQLSGVGAQPGKVVTQVRGV